MLVNIRVAKNGFVLVYSDGGWEIAKTLAEAAVLIGEQEPQTTPSGCHYAENKTRAELDTILHFAFQGYKIDAIKRMRDLFVPRLGLREAKELVEALMG